MKGIPCDPNNPECKKALSTDWNMNYDGASDIASTTHSLSVFRPDTAWRRSWRERHSLNFFVNFSAPQMAGFFDSDFWNRLVIQTSYHEPAILHAITAIGALHESILQRAFADEKRKAKAMEFALAQCNKSIAELTSSQSLSVGLDLMGRSSMAPNPRLALTTCVLFTCFEALQGRCDSAVSHALQGRRLLQATEKPFAPNMTRTEADDLENMRPIVERLEVQATALLDKGRRPEADQSPDRSPPLPPITHPHSLDHAHSMLHSALNSVMRYMQAFQPTAPRDRIALSMHDKYAAYVPWFARWEEVFTAYLAAHRESMTSADVKRAMVLKANHLVGSMLASVDQAAGPVAYDAYEAEFRAIVDLSREVLASFSCPPLPTLTGGNAGTPYLSFSLWVTDPLWMAISRCRNPSIRQAAFALLSQNPRQEGIWHAGPMLSGGKNSVTRREGSSGGGGGGVGEASSGRKKAAGLTAAASKRKKRSGSARAGSSSRTASVRPRSRSPLVQDAAASTPARSRAGSGGKPLEECETRVKDEWYAD